VKRAIARLDHYQRDHRWLGYPIAVLYKFTDDQGPYLAALLTYYGFLSLFPLLLLLASILGILLQGNSDIQQRILDSAISQFPVIGDELTDPQGLQGNINGVIIGAIVALYGALGFAQALQNAQNVAWGVPRHRRPNPIMARLRSVLVIATAGAAVLATSALSVVAASNTDDELFASWVALPVSLIAVLVNSAIFAVAFNIANAASIRRRHILPGAVTAAVIWQLLQLFGTAYIMGVVNPSGTTYGVFAIVLGLLAWIYLAAVGVVIGTEINVVTAKRLYPRALLTPFTDNVDLTDADRRAYASAVMAQIHKGFESVDVMFEHDGQFASAQRHQRQLDGEEDVEAPAGTARRRRLRRNVEAPRPPRPEAATVVSAKRRVFRRGSAQ